MTTTKEYADGLRAIADWYEAHPEVPVPECREVTNYSVDTKEEALLVAHALAPCDKKYSETMFSLERSFGAVRLIFTWYRHAVCRRVVLGTEEIPARLVPASTREIVEWQCDPVLTPDEP